MARLKISNKVKYWAGIISGYLFIVLFLFYKQFEKIIDFRVILSVLSISFLLFVISFFRLTIIIPNLKEKKGTFKLDTKTILEAVIWSVLIIVIPLGLVVYFKSAMFFLASFLFLMIFVFQDELKEIFTNKKSFSAIPLIIGTLIILGLSIGAFTLIGKINERPENPDIAKTIPEPPQFNSYLKNQTMPNSTSFKEILTAKGNNTQAKEIVGECSSNLYKYNIVVGDLGSWIKCKWLAVYTWLSLIPIAPTLIFFLLGVVVTLFVYRFIYKIFFP